MRNPPHFISVCVTLAIVLVTLLLPARAQLLIGDRNNGGRVGLYDFDGTAINANLLTGLGVTRGIAVLGDSVFVARPNAGLVGHYKTDGATVNSAFISGVHQPFDVAASASHFFVAEYGIGQVSKHAADGSLVNGSLIAGLDSSVYGVEVFGESLLVAMRNETTGEGRIGKYTFDGDALDPFFVTGLGYAFGMTVSGTSLFITNQQSSPSGDIRAVMEYDAIDGSIIAAPLISGLVSPAAIAVTSDHLFVTSAQAPNGWAGKYQLSGDVVNATLVTGLSGPEGITVIAPAVQSVPDRGPTAALLGLLALLALRGRGRR